MEIAVVGTGYVGLVTGLTFAKLGHKVHLVDVVPDRVKKLSEGIPPFYEPGLQELMDEVGDMIHPTLDLGQAVFFSDASFICVGTPPKEDGSQNSEFIISATEGIGDALAKRTEPHVVVVKSTVEPGTSRDIVLPILEERSGKKVGEDIGLCMNPEFLREGSAIKDSFEPDRVVIGEVAPAADPLVKVYEPLGAPIVRVTLETAEMIKYASNAFLATKISYANEMANLCERMDIDALEMLEGMAMDQRINPKFFIPGFGYGGSCFPKDVKAIVSVARRLGEPTPVLEAVLNRNELQPLRAIPMLKDMLGDLSGKKVTILGAAFKPETDDVRESRSFVIADSLVEEGATVRVHDPMALENFKELRPDLEYYEDMDEAIKGADAVIIVTAWNIYRELTPTRLNSLMDNVIILDARRTFEPDDTITYRSIGLPYRK